MYLEDFLCKFIKPRKKPKYFLGRDICARAIHTYKLSTVLQTSTTSAISILQKQCQRHKRAIPVFHFRFLLQQQATRLTGSPQVSTYVFLKNRKSLIIHFINHIQMPSGMMSPSEAKTMSDFHYIVGKSSFCLSLHLS